MPFLKPLLSAALAAGLFAVATGASAQIRITEVAPWASGNSPYAVDWFELTNTGTTAVSLSGWKMDDNSASFGSAVALSGITSIAAGESVIFVESASGAAISAFKSTWFGTSVPAGLQVGYYSGSGVGLGASGDAVYIYNSTGTLVADVLFGASSSASPYRTFDNAAGLDNVTLTQLSAVGVQGAFIAVNDAVQTEIGSPGSISAVPEPATFALAASALALIGVASRKRQG